MKPNLRILNLEDDLADAELNQAMLQSRWPECQLVRVTNREELISALEAGGFDIILSDYSIPGFDGREALRLAREIRPELPFVFVSGTIGEDTAIEALKNGATDYVLKNRLVRLIPSVDRALREVEERRECERAEESMRQSEHKYRQLFECLGDAAFLADEPSGKIIDTNHCAEKLLGCSRAEIIGRKQSQFLSAAGRLGTNEANGANGIVVSAFESEMIRPDGKTIPVDVRATRLTLYGRPLVLRLCHDLSTLRPG